jgi:membrane protease YdiL (CAAX protease family)
MVAFLVLGSTASSERRGTFFLALTVAPMIRIVSLGIPLWAFPRPLWYVLSSAPLFLAGVLIARQIGARPSVLGIRLPARSVLGLELAVASSGLGLGALEWLILRPDPIVDGSSVAWIAAAALMLLIGTGLLEEFLFRGLMQYGAGRLFGDGAGVIVTAAVFGVLHIGHLSLVDVLFVGAVGLYFGLVVRRTGSILGVTIAHGLTNFMLFVVFPLAFG